jgi:hypothetical protein
MVGYEKRGYKPVYEWIRFQEFICESQLLGTSNAFSQRNNVISGG